jgi:enoyl-CoA hydratase/carnithine racemase
VSAGFSIAREGAVEWLQLDKAGRLNALDLAAIDALGAYFAALRARPEIRCVLIQGAGEDFCAGLDLTEWRAVLTRGSAAEMFDIQARAAGLIRAMRAAPQPLIGLAQGAAAGIGFAILLACDLRLGAPDLRMNVASVRIGLSGADVGISFLLPRIVGEGRAAELMLTGRPLGAEEALAAGLLAGLADRGALEARGRQAAEAILRNAPLGVAMTKAALAAAAPNLETAMAIEDRQQILLAATDDHREAVSAFFEKRAPVFTGR